MIGFFTLLWTHGTHSEEFVTGVFFVWSAIVIWGVQLVNEKWINYHSLPSSSTWSPHDLGLEMDSLWFPFFISWPYRPGSVLIRISSFFFFLLWILAYIPTVIQVPCILGVKLSDKDLMDFLEQVRYSGTWFCHICSCYMQISDALFQFCSLFFKWFFLSFKTCNGETECLSPNLQWRNRMPIPNPNYLGSWGL